MARRPPNTPRKRPRQERAQATVDAILDATAHILVRDGYDNLSTNRVAQRAGVSIGSLYQYYPNKEALVGELVDRYSAMLFDMVLDALATMQDTEPRVVVSSVVRAMIETKREQPALAKVLREQIPRTGRLARYEQELEKVIALAAAFLARHRERLRVDDVEVAAFVVVTMLDALTHATVTQDPHEDEVMVRAITDAAGRYLLRDP